MKKLLLIGALVLASFAANAASLTTTIAAGGYSNLLSGFNGSATVSSIVLTSVSTNVGRVSLIDSPTNSTTYTSPAYDTIATYATNVITRWTNYYGVANSFTNVGIIDYTNSVAASTNNYPIRLTAQTGTNSTSLYSGVDYYFVNGVWATNLTTGSPITVTITYQK